MLSPSTENPLCPWLMSGGRNPKEMVLAFEKEVLGIYLSGHPLESDQELWQKHITNTTGDFALDEETGSARVEDQARVVSTARLFTSLSEVRSRNSFRFWNGPLALRSATMSSMAAPRATSP